METEASQPEIREERRGAVIPEASLRGLQASEQKLAAMLIAESKCVKLLEADSTLLEINEAGLGMLEAESTRQVLGHRLLELLVVEEDRPSVKELLRRVIQGERATLECRLRGLKGRLKWIELNAAPYYDERSGRTFILAISREITRRKLAEEQIRRLNRLYAVSSSINEAIVRIGDTHKIYERACQIAVEQGELVMAWIALPDEAKEKLLPAVRWGRDQGYLDRLELSTHSMVPAGQGPAGRAFRSGQPAFCNDISDLNEIFAYREEALERGYRSCGAFALRSQGTTVGLLVVYADVVDYFQAEELKVLTALADNLAFARESHLRELQRQEAEHALRRSEERFRSFMAHSPAAGWIADSEGRLRFVSETFARLLRAPGSLEGKHISELFEAPFVEVYLRNNRTVLEAGRAIEFTEPGRRPDGTVGDFLVIKFPLPSSEGSPLLGALALDITERKSLEQQLLRSQRLESLGTLASGIAHDLNNALSPILTSVDLLALKFPDENSQTLLRIVRASAERGADMVKQVLSFGRGVAGRRVEVQLRHLVRDVQKMAEDTFLKNTQVRTQVAPGIWPVMGDPTQLHQVLMNLCVNARDALPYGGTITISLENLELDAATASQFAEAKPGSYVKVGVEDTGMGIPPELLDKIFDPFFTTKEVGKGTGLGLSISLGIVKNHGGFFHVRSTLGQGTCFQLYLPAQPASAGQEESPGPAELPRGHEEYILLVDDEAAVREFMRLTLEAFGYRVLLAADGTEAIGVFASHSMEISLVLTDITMPRMNGLTAISILRQLNPRVPIIATSGLDTPDHRSRCQELGVQHFLAKPYTAEALLKLLRSTLRASEQPTS